MKLSVNGEMKDIEGDCVPLPALLNSLGLGQRRVAIEVNEKIIKRHVHAVTMLKDGDVIEIVHFVGGGN